MRHEGDIRVSNFSPRRWGYIKVSRTVVTIKFFGWEVENVEVLEYEGTAAPRGPANRIAGREKAGSNCQRTGRHRAISTELDG